MERSEPPTVATPEPHQLSSRHIRARLLIGGAFLFIAGVCLATAFRPGPWTSAEIRLAIGSAFLLWTGGRLLVKVHDDSF